jgi:hypothetical protein
VKQVHSRQRIVLDTHQLQYFADSDLSFGLSHDVGYDFDTFQREQVTKVTFGYKY